MRANTQGRVLEEALLENNIPYTISGGSSFFERQEIKDVVSYLDKQQRLLDGFNYTFIILMVLLFCLLLIL